MSSTVTKPPRDRTFAALGVVAGIAGGLVMYQGVTHAREANAEPPSHTANVMLDAAPMPDPVTATVYDDVAGAPDPAAAAELAEPTIVARQPVEAGSGSGTAAPPVGVTPAPAAPLDLAPEPTVEQRLAEALKLIEAYKAATSVTAKRVVIFGALSVGVKLLLDILLLLMPVLGARAKKWIPYVAGAAGVLIGALTKLAAGEPWLVAILYGAGPPLAVYINELLKRRKPEAVGQPALVPR